MTITTSLTVTLACVIVGEAGAMPLPAQIGVADVALNRLNAGMGFDGWHAMGEPTPRSLMVAELAMQLPDTTGGAMHALSREDIWRLGFRDGDIVYEGPAGLETHLFWKWPEGER